MGNNLRNIISKSANVAMIIGLILLVAEILLTVTKDPSPTVTRKAIITGEIKKVLDEQEKIITEIKDDREVIAFINGDNVKKPQSKESLEISDADWVANGMSSALASDILGNNLSKRLKEYDERSPLISEIILTGKAGHVIGASNLTSDYYQADEAWWQKAAAETKSPYVLDAQSFDDSIGISMSSAILENDEFIGIIKIVIDVDALAESL